MKAFALIFAVVFASLACFLLSRAHRATSVCMTCGKVYRVTYWTLTLRILLFESSSEHETPLSLCLTTNGIVGNHSHLWVGADGVRSTAESGHAASLVAKLHNAGEYGFREKMLTNIFDINMSSIAQTVAVKASTNSFPDRATLHAWIVDNTAVLEEMSSTRADQGLK